MSTAFCVGMLLAKRIAAVGPIAAKRLLSRGELKMLVKIYWSIWGLLALAALLLFATGNLTMLSLIVLGFVAFGITFMGMIGVLPAMVTHPVDRQPAKVKSVAVNATPQTHAKAFHIFKSA